MKLSDESILSLNKGKGVSNCQTRASGSTSFQPPGNVEIERLLLRREQKLLSMFYLILQALGGYIIVRFSSRLPRPPGYGHLA